MSLEERAVVAEAKSPFSTSATDTPRTARSPAAPAPAIPPPMMTTSYSASASAQGRAAPGSAAKRVQHHGQPQTQANRHPELVHLVFGGVVGMGLAVRGRDADADVAARWRVEEQAPILAGHHRWPVVERGGAQLGGGARAHERGLPLVVDDG